MQDQNPALEEHLNERLSAIIDGEASELELRRFMQQLDELEPGRRMELYARWERYQRITVGLSGEAAAAQASVDFLSNLSTIIGNEPVIESGARVAVASLADERVKQPLAMRFAVAASIGLAVIVGFQQLQINNQTEALRLANNSVNTTSLQSSSTSNQQVDLAGIQTHVASAGVASVGVASIDSTGQTSSSLSREPVDAAEAQRRLQEYLFEHANHASQQRSQGIVPFARVASFETSFEAD